MVQKIVEFFFFGKINRPEAVKQGFFLAVFCLNLSMLRMFDLAKQRDKLTDLKRRDQIVIDTEQKTFSHDLKIRRLPDNRDCLTEFFLPDGLQKV